jgi:hypothetical protein
MSCRQPTRGFERFTQAAITTIGIEFVHRIESSHFDVSAFCIPQTRTPQVWGTVLVA